MNFNCEICKTSFSTKQRYITHKETEKHKIVYNIYETCKLQYQSIINNLEHKLNNEIKEKLEVLNINNQNNTKIKELEDKSEDYKKIVENLSNSISFKNIEILDNNHNNFKIDIKFNNNQNDKIKTINNNPDNTSETHSLKLKDKYQLEYRKEDSYINITNLCKAGGKKFNDWNRLDKTNRFLEVLSVTTGIPTVNLLKKEQGKNGERHTWSHPQVAINIAQWISPEFDVLVSKWTYEFMLKSKVDIRDDNIKELEKKIESLDTLDKENKLLKTKIKLLESKVLQKQPREVYENSKNVIYIVTTEYKETLSHYKIGKAFDLQNRLSVYNTTDKHIVIYYTQCSDKETMNLLEKLVHKKLNGKRIEPNKEWFLSEDNAEDFIKVIDECKQMLCD
jgi:hypothetical protein